MSFVTPSRLGVAAAFACLVALAGCEGTPALAAPRVDTEEDLQARIEHEHDPVRKAKYEIRLARLKLLRGEQDCAKDDHEACHRSLGSYMDLTQRAWNGLVSSGRRAVKQSAGFKELDIGLREDARELRDSERNIPFEDRDYIDGVIRDINALHEKVLAALFPDGAAPPPESKPAPPREAHLVAGRAK